ncbi:MAG: multicopper oxidase family protein [Bradymonadia bacterium]
MKWCVLCCLWALVSCDDESSGPIISGDASSDAAVPDLSVSDAEPRAESDLDPPDAETERPEVGMGDALVAPEGPEGAVPIYVTLEGAPAVGGIVVQGGRSHLQWPVDDVGWAFVEMDWTVEGEHRVVASHPDARQLSVEISPDNNGPYVVELSAFSRADNPEYRFQDPGTPDRRDTTAQCGHCHLTINDGWAESAHRRAASNPAVHDLYAGTARYNEASCAEAGGRWLEGRRPRGGQGGRCYLGAGYLPERNPECADGPCPEPQQTGHCADCHAPAINGVLGGRDLLEATDFAYDYGVMCDTCHRVSEVDLESENPGISGRLNLMRPSETASFTLGAGGFLPLTFGPSHDSPNPRMGSVQRDHYRNGRICGGCHQLEEPVTTSPRWPNGKLPVQSTWQEWLTSPTAEEAFCPDCHMPPAADVENSADLQAFPLADTGVVGGWKRPPGSVRHHTWPGGKSADDSLLRGAAAVFVELTEIPDGVDAAVTVKNVSAGHHIPTGEPMRAMLLEVQARCGEDVVQATGGDAVPGHAGAEATFEVEDPQAMSQVSWPDGWPAPEVGDVVRVVRRGAGFHDYDGFEPFGPEMPAEEKGLPILEVVGSRAVVAHEEAGPRLEGALPEGHIAYLIRDTGGPAPSLAGASGFAFARVLVDGEGRAMVPHFQAVDVRSDNRLAPQQAWTSHHVFPAACPDLRVEATLWYRAHPKALAREKGWPTEDRLMTRGSGALVDRALEPADQLPSGATHTITLAARQSPEGGYTYNDGLPIIRATVGDRLEATLENQLDAPTTIHWHGVKVPEGMDGTPRTQAPVQPGETFDYAFDLTHPGTFWFHPHFDTEGQVDRGLYGVLLVEPTDLPPPSPETYEELVLVFDAAMEARPADEDGDRSAPGHAHGHGRLVTEWLVNGELAPLAFEAPDRPVRVRIVNASNTGYLSLRWPQMRHIEGQQGFLPRLATPDRVVLPPGARAGFEWLVDAPFAVETTPYSLNGGDALGEPVTLVEVSPTTAEAPAPFPWPFTGATLRADPGHTDVVYAFTGSDRSGRWRINGERPPTLTPTVVPLGQGIVIELRNISPTSHPFHLHGLHFEVLSRNGLPPEMATWADTVDVHIGERVRLWVPLDNPGEWMAHCHILPHAEDGMMALLRVE